MSVFQDNSVTDQGRMLFADIQMGAAFVPTRVVIGSGYLPTGETTRTIKDVVAVEKEMGINKMEKLPDGSVVFGAKFSNEEVEDTFYYRELGLYAKAVYPEGKETKEVLYSYGNAGVNAELIPAYNTNSILERQLDLIVYIGNDTEVKLEIKTGLFVDFDTFYEKYYELKEDIEEAKYITDTITFEKYKWKMEDGTLSLNSVSGSVDNVNIADKETMDIVNESTTEIKKSIGVTADSNGTERQGSVFAKLNCVLNNVFILLSRLPETLAEKINDIGTNVSTILTRIGTSTSTSDTTLFGKLNKGVIAMTIKSVQRGNATSAGTITINSVDMNKTVIHSVSKGSAGYVAVRGNITGNLTASSHSVSGSVKLYPSIEYWTVEGEGTHTSSDANKMYHPDYTGTASLTAAAHTVSGTRTISGGTTDLTVKEYSAVLASATTIAVDGPCEWQVVEYY